MRFQSTYERVGQLLVDPFIRSYTSIVTDDGKNRIHNWILKSQPAEDIIQVGDLDGI